MTSFRQIESNRRNAQKSTGPKTKCGKQRASQNAVRHGLTAETVIKLLEDPDDYRSFELTVTTDYQAETAVERELVLRLASLLWRLRRATSIETGLFQSQDNILPEPGQARLPQSAGDCDIIRIFQAGQTSNEGHGFESMPASGHAAGFEVARRFLRLGNLDNGVFERLGRYEVALWRQVRQTILTLEALRWRAPSARQWRTQDRWQRTPRAPCDDDQSDSR